MIVGCASVPRTTPPDPSRPSISETTKISFVGVDFELRDKATNQAVPVWEYFPPSADSAKWDELVDFRVYPVHANGNDPMDHAARTVKLFKQQYPYMQFALYSDKKTGAALLDFLCPTSSRKDGSFYEFNAFKFFRDAGSPNVISFHYVKNIPCDVWLSPQIISSQIKATRKQVVPAMVLFPLYRQ
jgi:hypothetical protein